MTALDSRTELTLLVEMRADWHVGSGAGRVGHVDRRVARDPEGLPWLPAKTLTGIWRDACEQVAWALDGGAPNGPWSRLLAGVFGDPSPSDGSAGSAGDRRRDGPRPALLSVRPARLGAALRAALRPVAGATVDLRDALTFVEPGVTIDGRSGRAMDDHLRFTEVARGGCTLRAEGCGLDLARLPDRELRRAAWALLVAGVRMVDRLGADRRRGSGGCRWSIEGLAEDEERAIVGWLRAHPEPPDIERSRQAGPPALHEPEPGPAGGWWEVPLRIRLLDPVIVANGVAGNVTTSLDHVPGRLLLPILEEAMSRAGLDATGPIRRGELRVLPAHLELDGERGRPVPLCLGRPKDAGDRGTFHRMDAMPGHRQVRAGYVGAQGEAGVAYGTVEMALHVHNTVRDDTQQPEGGGGVFSHEAIRAGTTLRTIVCVGAGLARPTTAWWRHLEGEHRLGRSTKDDYGRVAIDVLAEPAPAARDHRPRAGELWVWCLSDVLLDDVAHGEPSTSVAALAAELSQALGLGEGALEAHDQGPVSLRSRRHDAWQARWGMPRPSLVAIAAGSVVRFALHAPLEPDRAAAVLREGIGLRRAEGFGDVAFNDPLLELESLEYRPPGPGPAGDPHEPGDMPEADRRFAETVEREAWRSLIRTAAIERGASQGFRAETLAWGAELAPSQLGTLRMMARARDRVERLERWRGCRSARTGGARRPWTCSGGSSSRPATMARPRSGRSWMRTAGGR